MPWLRKHGKELQEMVAGEWSWRSLAEVLTRSGITHKTGNPWSARLLESKTRAALQPLKGAGARRKRVGAVAEIILSDTANANAPHPLAGVTSPAGVAVPLNPDPELSGDGPRSEISMPLTRPPQDPPGSTVSTTTQPRFVAATLRKHSPPPMTQTEMERLKQVDERLYSRKF
jgi:hypothetical protein